LKMIRCHHGLKIRAVAVAWKSTCRPRRTARNVQMIQKRHRIASFGMSLEDIVRETVGEVRLEDTQDFIQ